MAFTDLWASHAYYACVCFGKRFIPFCYGRKRKKLDAYAKTRTTEKLLSMVGRGRVSAAAAVDVALAIMEDCGDCPAAIAALASLGSHGAYPGNCERDLLKWLDCQFGFRVQPYPLTLRLQAS